MKKVLKYLGHPSQHPVAKEIDENKILFKDRRGNTYDVHVNNVKFTRKYIHMETGKQQICQNDCVVVELNEFTINSYNFVREMMVTKHLGVIDEKVPQVY